MASKAPQAQNLPLFYNDLVPLSSNEHADWKAKRADGPTFLATQHAVPITADEFIQASRYYPIVFSVGDNPVPLALMGLNEGVNVFVDAEGTIADPVYIPAYVRRYPFMLARLQPESDELSLCFDPTSEVIGKFEEGEPLFVDGQPSEAVTEILGFCEQFEQAGMRTGQFMQDLEGLDILMDGEVAIQQQGVEQPFIYRGFRMIDENKLRELRGDQLRKIAQNGMLPLLYAHLFSMQLMRDIFARQVALGKAPVQTAVPAGEAVN